MRLIALPQGFPQQPLPFYLTLEEWAAAALPLDEEYLLVWQVTPTVIYGRHQDPAVELDLDFCRRHGIARYRRRSGGGAVYADLGNVMISVVTAATDRDVPTTFADHTARIAAMLRALGLNAEATGRNDVAIDGRKVAGHAFERLPRRSIIHGTMLLDFAPEAMSGALTPSRAKLESKGVKSVPSRITTLRQYSPSLTVEQFVDHVERFLCGDSEPLLLTPEQVAEVERQSRPFYDPRWLDGGHWQPVGPDSRRVDCRIDGVGQMSIIYKENPAMEIGVEIIGVEGDFFALVDDPVAALNGALASPDGDTSKVIAGLRRPDLLAQLAKL